MAIWVRPVSVLYILPPPKLLETFLSIGHRLIVIKSQAEPYQEYKPVKINLKEKKIKNPDVAYAIFFP